jgi:hypothetical protein
MTARHAMPADLTKAFVNSAADEPEKFVALEKAR